MEFHDKSNVFPMDLQWISNGSPMELHWKIMESIILTMEFYCNIRKIDLKKYHE
jgi:hypothetical protein